MASVEIINNFDIGALDDRTRGALKDAVTDVTLDLLATARGVAPHYEGDLEKGINEEIIASPTEITGLIGVRAIGGNGFDYGILRHDHPFKLGEGSLNKGSGGSPMFGDTFSVGYGFISRPAEALQDEYLKYIQEEFNKALEG